MQADRPGELVGMDCFFAGCLRGTKPRSGSSRRSTSSSYAWAELVTCPTGYRTGEQTSWLARRVVKDCRRSDVIAQTGWTLTVRKSTCRWTQSLQFRRILLGCRS